MTGRRTVVAAAIVAGLGLLGLLVGSSGLVPIAASSGHWAITDWFLHYVMQRSVATQSLGIEVPNLVDPAMVRRGAGHYAAGCANCHGAPGFAQSIVVRHQTPATPELAETLHEWQPRELFWIVKHGVKYTAMPAWPAQERDDEVWAVVAFLLQMPDMDPGAYREAAFGSSADRAGHAALVPDPRPEANCEACHGADGGGRQGTAPVLAGQSLDYLVAKLDAYADDAPPSGMMAVAAGALTVLQRRELAAYYAELAPMLRYGGSGGDTRGREIAERGLPTRGIAACAGCHGPSPTAPDGHFPKLLGQDPAWLEAALRRFAESDAHESGQAAAADGQYAGLMQAATHRLEADDLRAVLRYYTATPETRPVKAAGEGRR